MLSLSCLCGAVRLTLAERPEFIHDCNCTLCTKSGARWSYVHPAQVMVEGSTSVYRRTDKAQPNAELHFCPTCGTTTHFGLTESAIAQVGNSMMGVNMWLADPADLAGMELRFPDGRSWTGDGAFTYVRDALVLTAGGAAE